LLVGFMPFTLPLRPEARVINYLQVDYERRGPRQNLIVIKNSKFKLGNSPFIIFDSSLYNIHYSFLLHYPFRMHYATNRQVAGLIPDCVIGIFQ
jgi:hypothetical protein